jgi:hypothetical protein
MIRMRRTGAALLVLVSTVASARPTVTPLDRFDERLFRTRAAVGLCFDLTFDELVAGLKINDVSDKTEQRTVILPFELKTIAEKRELWVTHGSQDGVTLINYILTPDAGAHHAIGFMPLANVIPDGNDADMKRFDFDDPITHIHNGLQHRFVYRVEAAGSTDEVRQLRASLPNTPVGEVLVRLPPDVKPQPPPRGATVAKELRIDRTRGTDVFVFAGDATAIDISYDAEPSSGQKQIFDIVLKIFVAWAEPLIALGIASSQIDAKKRRIFLWGGVLFQLVLLGGLAYWAFYVAPVVGWQYVSDIAVAVIGLGASIAVAAIKG